MALLVMGACGVEPAPSLRGGQSPTGSSGKADDAHASSDFDRLVALLKTDGTLVMPPIGVDNAANELDVTVTVHPADKVKAVAAGIIAEVSEMYVIDSPTGTLVDHYDEDIKVSLASGWNDDDIRRDLLATVKAGKRDEVAALLDGYFLHFRTYQTASEITADEIFVYRPSDLDRAIIIRFSYVHA